MSRRTISRSAQRQRTEHKPLWKNGMQRRVQLAQAPREATRRRVLGRSRVACVLTVQPADAGFADAFRLPAGTPRSWTRWSARTRPRSRECTAPPLPWCRGSTWCWRRSCSTSTRCCRLASTRSRAKPVSASARASRPTLRPQRARSCPWRALMA